MPFSSPSGRCRGLIIPEEYEKWNLSVYAVSADTVGKITGTDFLDDEIENIVEAGIARCGGRDGCIALKPSQNLLRLFLVVNFGYLKGFFPCVLY